MDNNRFVPGSVCERTVVVDRGMTASAVGNEGVEVLATPVLVKHFELTAMACIETMLDKGEGSLGTSISVQHLAATPVGGQVRFPRRAQDRGWTSPCIRARGH